MRGAFKLIIIILIWAGPVFARIINIPADYPTIQAGIDAAINGDTVLVAPGEYTENAIIEDKNILLTSSQGPDNTIIKGYASIRGEIDTTCQFRGFAVHFNIALQPYHPSLVNIRNGARPIINGNIIEANNFNYASPIGAPGAGINCGSYPDYGSPIIRGNIIRNNWTALEGGGIAAAGQAIIEGNIIADNLAGYTPCESGDAGGISLWSPGEMGIIRYNLIVNNTAMRYGCHASGGGIDSYWRNNSLIHNNTIVENAAIINIYDSQGGGIGLWTREGYAFPRAFINNIIAFNRYGGGVYAILYDSSEIQWDYNLVFGNGGGDYIGIEPGPHDFQADPLFVDRFSGDYRLLPNSPCIDAGDPNMPLDPDGTRADIGAYYFDQSVGIDEDGAPTGPYRFSLRQNYPNPFNGETIISYHLDKESTVSLFIFSITGHLVLPLLNKEIQGAGEHKYLWEGRDANGSSVSTGIYFYELYVNEPATTTAGKHRESKAMILIK